MTTSTKKPMTDDTASGSKSFVRTVRNLFRSVFPHKAKSPEATIPEKDSSKAHHAD